MPKPLSLRRLLENEVVFRRANEKVQKFMQQQNAEQDAQPAALHFYCECSNEDCRERIVMTPARYAKLHDNRRHFIIKPGHGVANIEKIVKIAADYSVVEKHVTPPEKASRLHSTPL